MADDTDPDRSSAARGPASSATAFDRPAAHARTDRQSAGRSVETSPESLYLWQIAVLDARVERLQERVEVKERDLQHVIDRYEGVLRERQAARDGELYTDGGSAVDEDSPGRRTPTTDRDGALGRALAALRSLVER